MKLKVKCPHCRKKPIETIRANWYVNGFIFTDDYGTRNVIGCKACVQKQTWLNMLRSSTIGWLSVQGILGTPLVLVQNFIVAVISTSSKKNIDNLTLHFDELGTNINDLEIGEDGLTKAQRLRINLMSALLHEAFSLGKLSKTKDLDLTIEILKTVSNQELTNEAARNLFFSKKNEMKSIEHVIDFESKMFLFISSIKIIRDNKKIKANEQSFLTYIAIRLDLSTLIVDNMVEQILYINKDIQIQESDYETMLARLILGVDRKATSATIKRHFQELLVTNNLDFKIVNEKGRPQAENITNSIKWAYRILK